MAEKKSRDQSVYIEDMLESIELIQNYLTSISEADFAVDIEKQDAVIRRLEIIGEACKQVLPHTKGKFPDIPWREMAGMRDVVIHQYFGVTVSLIWKVASRDLPSLKDSLLEVKQYLERS